MNEVQDIISAIERSDRILVVTHRKPDGDAIGSLMALSKALLLLGKEVTAVCTDPLPETFSFLPEIERITSTVPDAGDFVVVLDCDKTEVDRLKYHLEGNKIHIVITPKKGRFEEKNVSFQKQGGNYDLIISVDVAGIEQFGKLYEENASLFAQVPIINIDHHSSNPGFGKINLIDIGASSTAEILYGLIHELEAKSGKTLITSEVATFLLSGITTDTGAFQNANTTPKAMEIAASLMDSGAAQQDIIKYLFRTKKLSTLKLWGSILTKVEVDTSCRLVWSTMTKEDLLESGAKSDESGGIIDELLVHAPEAEIVAFFKEDEGMVGVSLRSKTPQANVMEIAQSFGGGGHVMASGIKFPGKTLAEVQSQVITKIQDYQKKRLGLDEQKSPGEVKITQVLEGYTAVPVSETLEEKVSKKADIHEKTRSAIRAEQSQHDATGTAPSKLARDAGVKPPEKRFTDDVPSFLKTPPTPPSPPVDSVKVMPAPSTPVPTPEIPKDSKAPEVKIMNQNDGAKPPTPPTPPVPPKDPFAIGDDGLTDIERALGGL